IEQRAGILRRQLVEVESRNRAAELCLPDQRIEQIEKRSSLVGLGRPSLSKIIDGLTVLSQRDRSTLGAERLEEPGPSFRSPRAFFLRLWRQSSCGEELRHTRT